MSSVCARHRQDQQRSNDEVQRSGNDTVVVRLRQCVFCPRLYAEQVRRGERYEDDEEDRGNIPSDDGDGLGDCEAEAAGHVEEEGHVGCESEDKGYRVNRYEPAGTNIRWFLGVEGSGNLTFGIFNGSTMALVRAGRYIHSPFDD